MRSSGTDHLVGGHNELKGTGCYALVEGVGGEEGCEVGALSSGLFCCQHGFQHIVIQLDALQQQLRQVDHRKPL